MADNNTNVNQNEISADKLKYRGRIRQIPIYIGKMFRMFVFQSDWKVIPMATFIAILVIIVIKKTFAVTMEGTAKGALAITSIALWNGCFNSIQVVCRERDIVKREHRSGMHISSYIFAHMVYQAFLCIIQSLTTCAVFFMSGMTTPGRGIVTGSFMIDFFITIFLVTYASDMLSLLISCIAKTTTAAMTVMPLVLMVQLIFSGAMFSLPDSIKNLSPLMISNHGIAAINAEARYNELTTSSGWKLIKKVSKNSDDPEMILMIEQMEEEGYDVQINAEVAKSNYKIDYECSRSNVLHQWEMLAVFVFVFAVGSVIALEFVDKDKR